MKKRLHYFTLTAVLMLVAGSLHATTFTATSPGGLANIDVTSSSLMTIKLTNTTAGVDEITDVLDGFLFTFSTAPTSITLTDVALGGTPLGYLCNKEKVNGVWVSSCEDDDPTDDGFPFYEWTVEGSNPFLAAAGDGSYKPYGIVNDTITPDDGIPNDQHNPFLNGPVTFTLTMTGFCQSPRHHSRHLLLWDSTR